MSDYKQFCNEHNFKCNKASAAAWDAYIKEESVEFVMGWSRSYFEDKFETQWDRKATDEDWNHFKEMYDDAHVDGICEMVENIMNEILTDSFWNCSECDEVKAGVYDADCAPACWDARLCVDCFVKMSVPCCNCKDDFVLQDNDDAFEYHWKHKKDGVKVFWFCSDSCKDDYKHGHDYYFDNFYDYKKNNDEE